MPRPESYRNIANRYVTAAENNLNSIHEAAGFSIYHAFESIGGAWLRHLGERVPRGHNRKINRFVQRARHTFNRDAALISMLVGNMRNNMLYPVANPDGSYSEPRNVITQARVQRLITGIRRLIRSVENEM